MDESDSLIFLVMVGMRFMWSSTHLVTQVSSCCFTWSSLLPASIESLALSLQYIVHWARRSWNFSNSLDTRAWAWARSAWQRSMHWCTCCMDARLSSQQAALHQNIRPCIFRTFSLSRVFTWSPPPPAPGVAAQLRHGDPHSSRLHRRPNSEFCRFFLYSL